MTYSQMKSNQNLLAHGPAPIYTHIKEASSELPNYKQNNVRSQTIQTKPVHISGTYYLKLRYFQQFLHY